MAKLLISLKGRETVGKVYVVQKGSNLLGWQHQRKLRIKLDFNNSEQVLLMEENEGYKFVYDKFKELFTDSLGLLHDFQIYLENY